MAHKMGVTPVTLAHGRARYTKGCRCGECRAANRAYQARYRATKLHAVPPAQQSAGMQRIETSTAVVDAVRAQLEDLGAFQRRPGLAAIAVRLAELLENPLALPHHAAAAHRLVELLGRLAKETPRPGRLAAVRDMTVR